jgi:hypothetical protein
MSEQSPNPLETADSPNHRNHLDELSTRQNRAPMALLEPPVFAEDSGSVQPPRPVR